MNRWPLCEVCHRPMTVGQNRRHGVCDPAHPAYQAPRPHDVGIAKSQLAAEHKWTPEQVAHVDRTIEATARMLPAFTADDIWTRLGDDFPVTKGMAARLTAAAKRGVIQNTGDTRFSTRGGAHCHNQRLSVWRSLIGGPSLMLLSQKDAR